MDDVRVTIDPYRLDREWVDHPDQMQKAGDLVAAAQDLVDRLKGRLDVKKAETELAIRKNPGRFGLDKATDASVAAAVTAFRGVVRLVERMNRAKKNVGLLKSQYAARQDCRPALENLVKLNLAGYFAAPAGPKGAARDDALKMIARQLSEPMPDKPKTKKKRVK